MDRENSDREDPTSAKNVKFGGKEFKSSQARKQVSELQESADFIRENPHVLPLVVRKVFQSIDKNKDEEISWDEIQVQSFRYTPIMMPELTSQRHSVLISSDIE